MRRPALAVLAAAAAAVACVAFADPAHAQQPESLAEGPVAVLPPGPSFVSIVDFEQPAGESFGPHSHIPGFVYVVDGNATLVDDGGSEMSLAQGEGHFTPPLAVHTHENADDRLWAGALAIGLVVAVIAVVLVARLPLREMLLPVLLAALVVGGAVALWNPWTNQWFFIGVRPEAARGGPMPLPGASRTYESPAFSELRLPPGPYVERLATTTVDPGGETGVSNAPGPVVFLVLDGHAEVTVGNRPAIALRHHQATLVQTGESARVLNPSGKELRLLSFALTGHTSSP